MMMMMMKILWIMMRKRRSKRKRMMRKCTITVWLERMARGRLEALSWICLPDVFFKMCG